MNGNKEDKIFREGYKVIVDVSSIRSRSAYGDYEDLLHFLSSQDAAKIRSCSWCMANMMCKSNFAERLKSEGYTVEIPGMHDAVELE